MAAMVAKVKPIFEHWSKTSTLWLVIFAVISSIAGVLLALQNFVPVSDLTRDPIAIGDLPFYSGIVSNFGLIFWTAAAAIHLFSAYILRQNGQKKMISQYMLASGGFTLMLLLDDMILIHDRVFPYYLHLSEYYLFVGYGLFIVFYVVYFRKTIIQSNVILLLLAVLFFGASMGLDTLSDIIAETGHAAEAKEVLNQVSSGGNLMNNLRYLAEDGAKFIGVIFWMVYSVQFCLEHLGLNKLNAPAQTSTENN